MAGEWRTFRLGAVCSKIGSGATPRGGSNVYLERGDVALIRSQNIYNESFNSNGLAYLTEQHAAELANVEVAEHDVLLNITGDSVARACQVDPAVLPARVNQHVAIIRPLPAVLSPRFLRYYLVSPAMQMSMLSLAGAGATRNALTKGMIESFEVPAPADVQEQRAIAHILSTLDDKIDLHRRMTQTLEETARAVFQSWFVDFGPTRANAERRDLGLLKPIANLFPDRFNGSELGEIPVGWTVGRFGDAAEVLRDQVNPADSPNSQFSHHSIPAFDEGQRPRPEYGESIKSLKFRVPTGTVLLSKLNPELERVWLVDVRPDERAICSTEFLVLRGRPPFTRTYVYCLARSYAFRRQLEALVTGTSKSHQRAQTESVLSLSVFLPPARIAEMFDFSVASLFARILDCRRESMTLAALREALLPKLMSGQLRVPAAQRLVGSTV